MQTDPITLLGVSEPVARLGAFLLAFAGFSLLEAILPRRARLTGRWHRWATNGGMLVLATGLVRGLALGVPLLAGVAAAGVSAGLGVGLFHAVDAPVWAEVLMAIILLDLSIWAQHVVTHKVPWLWRLHRVHHADRDLDASSALRFHPVEIALSAAWKLAVILALGPAAVAVVLFEIILNASAIFNHANLALPRWLDRGLRTLVVTPDMHRVHHSVHREEQDRNFGFCLSVWDRVFGTYRAEPRDGQAGMAVGLSETPAGASDRLGWSLLLPFRT